MKKLNLFLVFLMLLAVVVVGGCGSKFQISALEVSPEVCLSGETVTVSANVVYSGETAGDYDAELKVDGTVERTQTFSFEPGSTRVLSFTLTKNEPASYAVQLGNLETSFTVLRASNIEVSPDEVEVGQSVTVAADLQNVSGDEVVYSCSLFCQGEEVQSKKITMAADSTTGVTFTLSQASAGWYEVELLGISESFKVLKPAEFVVSGFAVTPDPVKVGEMATITADIENVGEVAGSYEVSLMVDGVAEETREITLDGGASTTELFSFTENVAGSYSLQLGDQQRELRVVQPVRLSTGTIILNEMSGGRSTLKVINNRDADVVVVLALSDEPETPLWAAYVRADASRSFRQIAPGTYIIYYTFGEDWIEEAKQFLTVYSYERFAEESTISQDAYSYTILTVTFGIESGEGSTSWDLAEEEFPSLE
jgi:hypothetical protein